MAAMDDRRQPEDAGVAECFVERTAAEIYRRRRCGPDDIVGADILREDVIANAVADEGFERWPGEANRRRPTDEHQEDCRQGGKQRAQRQAGSQTAETGLERREVTETLGETSTLPRGEHVDEAADRRDRKVAEVAEAEAVSQQKEDVAVKIRSGEGVQPFEHEEGGLGLPGMHGEAVLVDAGGRASCEISATKVRIRPVHPCSIEHTWPLPSPSLSPVESYIQARSRPGTSTSPSSSTGESP